MRVASAETTAYDAYFMLHLQKSPRPASPNDYVPRDGPVVTREPNPERSAREHILKHPVPDRENEPRGLLADLHSCFCIEPVVNPGVHPRVARFDSHVVETRGRVREQS